MPLFKRTHRNAMSVPGSDSRGIANVEGIRHKAILIRDYGSVPWLMLAFLSHLQPTSALPHGAEGHLLFHPYFPVYKVVQTERSKKIMYTACLRSCAHGEVLPVDL